jgi:L-ascorbate metabolism protein UlaG (beta-lactamase superfamily)
MGTMTVTRLRPLRALGAACSALVLSACSSPSTGPITPHFDGSHFSNPGHKKESSVAGYLWLHLITSQAEWPASVPLQPAPAPPTRVNDGSARITFVGHATLLIQVSGLNILTDPLWSERASPFSWAGPKRVTPPGVAFDALPKVDVVLISHNHYDHLDLPTLRLLDARDRPRLIAPLGNRALVAQAMPASTVSEHDWGAAVTLGGGATVHVEPMLHASGRSPFDQQRSLWAAYVVQAGPLKLLHVGDAGYGGGQAFTAAAQKHGSFDLALLPIGAYEPASFMADSHMSPAEAVKAMADAKAACALAHHFGSFQLGFESHDAPVQALQAARSAAGLAEARFPALQPGQALVLRPGVCGAS